MSMASKNMEQFKKLLADNDAILRALHPTVLPKGLTKFQTEMISQLEGVERGGSSLSPEEMKRLYLRLGVFIHFGVMFFNSVEFVVDDIDEAATNVPRKVSSSGPFLNCIDSSSTAQSNLDEIA